MTTMKTILGTLAVAIMLALAAAPARADAYGPTEPTRDLKALIAADPSIGTELEAAIAKADLPGIATLDDFYAHVDDTFRWVPVESTTMVKEFRPFFYIMGQSEALKANRQVEDWIKHFVRSFGQYLDTPASIAHIDQFTSDPDFHIDDFYQGPSGWLTFNQFFARQVRPGKRPIDGMSDGVTIVAPADSTMQSIEPITDEATIVVKDVTYTIDELLAGSAFADAFAGGTFVHAYLSVADYHRFHTPFAGKVLEAKIIPGFTFIDFVKAEDGSLDAVDGTGYQWRQERGLVILETEDLGLVAVLPIGMGQVSGVVVTAQEGAELFKGQEFGYFQFGGSDVIVLFQKDMAEITAQLGTHYQQGRAWGHKAGATAP